MEASAPGPSPADLLDASDAGTALANTTLPACRPPTSLAAPADIYAYFACLDADANGLVTFEEACAAGLPGCADALDNDDAALLDVLRAQFAALDADANGALSPAEFDAELAGFAGNATVPAPAPAPAAAVAAVAPAPRPIPAAASAAAPSRTRAFAAVAAALTALLALINA